jgi:hypothetical protein
MNDFINNRKRYLMDEAFGFARILLESPLNVKGEINNNFKMVKR